MVFSLSVYEVVFFCCFFLNLFKLNIIDGPVLMIQTTLMLRGTKADNSSGAHCKSQLCQQTLIILLHSEPV